jgi:putative FmdB family regulatory protein
MPRYDYDCAACGSRSELVHGVHDESPTICPACGGGPLKKAFAPPTIHFKGSGWAKMERRAGSAGKASAKDGEAVAASADASTDGKDQGGPKPPSDGSTKTATSSSGSSGEGGSSGSTGSANGSGSGPAKGDAAPKPNVPSTSGSSAG